MQIKTRYLSISINEEDLLHLTGEERDRLMDEMVKQALCNQGIEDMFGI